MRLLSEEEFLVLVDADRLRLGTSGTPEDAHVAESLGANGRLVVDFEVIGDGYWLASITPLGREALRIAMAVRTLESA